MIWLWTGVLVAGGTTYVSLEAYTVAIVIPYLVGIAGSLFFAFSITATLMLKIIATS